MLQSDRFEKSNYERMRMHCFTYSLRRAWQPKQLCRYDCGLKRSDVSAEDRRALYIYTSYASADRIRPHEGPIPLKSERCV
jgi:hypothetical protein